MTNPLRFLFVIDNLSTGGAQRQMINLALGLAKRGYQIEFFCYSKGDLLTRPLTDAGIPVHWCIKRSRFSTDIIWNLCNLVNRGKYDLVLSYLPTPNFYAILAGRILTLRRIPVVVSERRCDLPQGATLIERGVRQFYRLASHVVTNSHHQKVELKSKYPWLRKRITTIYNGLDLSSFCTGTVLSNNRPLQILAIASVAPHKNGLCLVEALKILRDQHGVYPQVDWIGQFFLQGERLQYLNEMNRLISEYGLENQWSWLHQRTDIVHQLQAHDLLVHPSYGEGLPNVVCEALACARPVIISDALDHSLLVQHGKSGFLFDFNDPADLADKLRLFANLTPHERRTLGQNGREFAEANLSLKRLTDEYEQLFLGLVIKC